MKTELYHDILKTIQSLDKFNVCCIDELEKIYPTVKSGTLMSIASTVAQTSTKAKYFQAQESSNEIYMQYLSEVNKSAPPGIIKQIADNYDLPATLVAKLILAKHIEKEQLHHENADLSDSLQLAKKQLRDTTLIQDKILANEVFMCTIYDYNYSPTTDIVRMNLGQKYEIKLYKQMEKLGIVYRSEEYLRKFGFDKTPDVKLEVPIAVDGFIIHWIESKARFADFEVHQEYLKNQYESYWNRFGPGMIIYWFGFLDELQDLNGKHFIIRDHVPKQILKLN